MTFVSALFSRTHFNANCFAVLNESFKVISLFSYQSSLFVVLATSHLYYHKHLSLSTTFLFYLKLSVSLFFNSSFRLAHLSYPVNNFFIFLTKVLYFKLPQSLPFSLPFLLSVPPHQRQLAYNSTRFSISQQLFPHFDKERQFHKFTELSSFSHILLSLLFEREFEIKFYSSCNIMNPIGCTMGF